MEFWRVESGEMADLLWTGSLLALGQSYWFSLDIFLYGRHRDSFETPVFFDTM